jgi:hypothetical protein
MRIKFTHTQFINIGEDCAKALVRIPVWETEYPGKFSVTILVGSRKMNWNFFYRAVGR